MISANYTILHGYILSIERKTDSNSQEMWTSKLDFHVLSKYRLTRENHDRIIRLMICISSYSFCCSPCSFLKHFPFWQICMQGKCGHSYIVVDKDKSKINHNLICFERKIRLICQPRLFSLKACTHLSYECILKGYKDHFGKKEKKWFPFIKHLVNVYLA